MNKKRIIFITQNLEVGGGTSSMSSLYTKIQNLYDIEIILLSEVGSAIVPYRNTIRYPSFWVNNYYKDFTLSKGKERVEIGFVKSLSRFLGFFGISYEKLLVKSYSDIIKSADFVISFGEGVATTFTQHIKGKPKAAWIHYEVSKNPYSKQLDKLYSKFDKIVCVSDIIAEGFGLIYPNLAHKTIGIHNIIDEERISKMSQEEIPEVYDKEVYNIISMGRLSYVKRFPEIPRIASELKSKGLKIHWRILGPECDDSEKKGILRNIEKYKVADCVEWLGNRTNPYPYLAKSDLFVILSTTEACPMVITEARVLNIPIVATNFSTSYEFINNNVDGIICPIENISYHIARVLSDENFKKHLKYNSFKRTGGNVEAIKRFKTLIDE